MATERIQASRGGPGAREPTMKTVSRANTCGPGWDRTSDLPRVKRTLFH